MSYIDGYVVPVKAGDKEAYRAAALKMSALFHEFGATRVVENWGDDVPPGKTTDFWGAVKCEPGEVVAFSWIEWPSKAVRDVGMGKLRTDPRMQGPMPFDGKRMIFGGFETLVDTARKG